MRFNPISLCVTLILMIVSAETLHAQTAPPTPPPGLTCTISIFGGKLVCQPPQTTTPGPQGQTGPQGPPGPQGPTGPKGPAVTGGPCVSADGSIALFVQLPDGSCLPVIATGSTAAVATAANSKSGLLLLIGTASPPGSPAQQ